jgi:hypothetical protein
VARTYKNEGWIGWGDWLGTGHIAAQNKKFRKFNQSRDFIRRLNLNKIEEWKAYCKSGKKPDDIPNAPQNVYKDKGWKGWADFLGKE